MKTFHNPNGLPPTYSDGIEVSSGGKTLYTAGQVAYRHDKSIPEGIEAQTLQTYTNLEAVLKSAGMNLDNIVKQTIFLTDPDDFTGFAKTRTGIMGDRKPASTLVYVKQLIQPELLIEIEVIAASPDSNQS
ncbi:RidA family protein [Kineobactrum salinum]|uniref:RidA family protein n=1 Tax=Kineobactrum salinum TaxID=2708301 RepID=A0A6C0U0Z9_9GAMM|nr:RidA family protein [Kineobactrum salinum]QIB65780.1 RidA family protein [Kineobactrum salinum]